MTARKILYRLFCLALFLTLFCFGYGKLNHLFMQKPNSNDVIHSFYEEKKDSCDVLFVGSSHAYRSFSPMELWNSTGITSYVLGTPSQPMSASYALVKEGIRTQHPKLIVLEMYSIHYQQDFVEAYFHEAVDAIPLGTTKLELFTDYLTEKTGWEGALTFLFPMLLYHSRWDSLTQSDYSACNTFLKGFQYSDQITPEKAPKKTIRTKEINEETMEFFKKIVQLCGENDTQLLLVGAPMARCSKTKRTIRSYRTVAEYASENGIPFIIMNDCVDEIGIDFETDFYDNTHLNAKGAEKVTAYMGEYLQDHYELTDHRDDPEYESWNESYEQYLDFLEQNGYAS